MLEQLRKAHLVHLELAKAFPEGYSQLSNSFYGFDLQLEAGSRTLIAHITPKEPYWEISFSVAFSDFDTSWTTQLSFLDDSVYLNGNSAAEEISDWFKLVSKLAHIFGERDKLSQKLARLTQIEESASLTESASGGLITVSFSEEFSRELNNLKTIISTLETNFVDTMETLRTRFEVVEVCAYDGGEFW